MAKKFEFKHSQEPVPMEQGQYQKHEVKDGKTAIAALIHITLAHTAEVLHGVLDAVSEHYKISKDEMMDVVMNHAAYKQVVLSRMLNDLGYFPAEEAAEEVAKEEVAKEEPAPAKPTKRKFIVKR